MTTILTDFVRRMDPEGPEPSQELFDQVWSALRGLLCSEMKRRSSWSGPPGFLGIVGYSFWTLPGPETDALDELTSECFEWIFVKRLKSLCQQAKTKPLIDGLVALSIRHFLLEVQRRNDPMGFRLFEVLRGVVERGVKSNQLRVVAGDSRIRNDSVIVAASMAAEGAEYKNTIDPESLVYRWIGRHLEDLLTASHKPLSELSGRLAVELRDWLEESQASLRFGDLASVTKREGRYAWATLFLDSIFVGDREGHFGVPGTLESEDLRRLAQISHCVIRSIDSLDERLKAKLYLKRLWRFLEKFATAEGEIGASNDGDELPSRRQISKMLDIPRERIPDFLEILGGFLKACRQRMGSGPKELAVPPIDPPESPQRRSWAAALAAREALAEEDRADVKPTGWSVGDIFDEKEGAQVPGVHWLVLEVEADRASYRCAPVDRCSLLGPSDLPLFEGDNAPWMLRSSFVAVFDAERFVDAHRIAAVDGKHLEKLLRSDPVGFHRVDEDFPAYKEWIEEGPALAHRHATFRVLPSRETPSLAPKGIPEEHPVETLESSRGNLWGLWVAAALAIVVAGLGFQMNQMRIRLVSLDEMVQALSEPIVGLPYSEVKFEGIPRGPVQVSVPTTATHVQVGMVVPAEPFFEQYRIELLSKDRVLYWSPTIPATSRFNVTFSLERLEYPDLRLHLFGLKSGEEIFVDEEKLEILIEDDF